MKNKISIIGLWTFILFLHIPLKASIASEDLFQLCSQVPNNPKCAEYKLPVPLQRYQGEEAKCKDKTSKKFLSCKLRWSSSGIIIYSEFGDKLKVLKGKRDTQELTIPIENIDVLVYEETSKPDEAAVLAFGLLGLLSRQKLSSITIQYIDTDVKESADRLNIISNRELDPNRKTDTELSNIDKSQELGRESNYKNPLLVKQKVIIMNRKSGQGMIQFLEFKTGKTAYRKK